MKRAFLLTTLLLAGCGGPPKPVPMDGAAAAQEIVAGQSASSAHMVSDLNYNYAQRLLEDGRYAELDALLDRLDKTDSIESLCSPTSVVLRLADVQRTVDDLPWYLHYSGRWAQSNPRGWALLAVVVALTHRGDSLMDACGRKHYPMWEQGQGYFQQGTQLAAKGNSNTKGWPYLDYLLRLPKDSWAITSAIRAHPDEVALYQVLANIWPGQTRAIQKDILKNLEAVGPTSYALFFTFHVPKIENGKIAAEAWKWATLKTGFEELLLKHPKALGVRNAYAVAAGLFSDGPVLQQQVAMLGYRWDPYYWESLSKYQSACEQLPDYHAASSQSQSASPDPEALKHAPPLGIEDQGRDLFEKRQWETLDALASKAPDRWKFSLFSALEEPAREDEPSYRKHETALRDWQTQRPGSSLMMSVMGAFYIHYAWLARGSGYASSVTKEGWKGYEERLALGEKFTQAAYAENPQDGAVMETLMIHYRATGRKREAADKLALAAAKNGRAGFPALLSYAVYLLPRWHGEPGDLVRAADRLRSQTGHDDAYAAMAETAFYYDGSLSFSAGDPAGMSFERWASSLEAAGKAGRISPSVLAQFLVHARSLKLTKLARRVAPYVPIDTEDPDQLSRPSLQALRHWALGETPDPWRPNPLRYDGSTPRQQKLKGLTQLGFRAHLDHVPELGGHFVMEVHCPPIQADDGTIYKRFTLFMDILPGESDTLNCYLAPSRPDEFVAGKYSISLLKDHKVLHQENFELTL